MRSYFPEHDIGKSRIYTGYFQSAAGWDDRVHAFVFVKAMRGTIVSDTALSFPRLDTHYRKKTLWKTAVQWDEKQGRKKLKQIAANLTRLTVNG